MTPPPPPSAPPARKTIQEFRTIATKPPGKPPTRSPAKSAKPAAPRKRVAPRLASAALPSSPGTPRKKAAIAGPKAAVKSAAPKKPAIPKTKPAPRVKLPSSRLDELQKIIVTSLDDDKAEAIVTLDLEGRAAFTDRMVIATGLADRQITAMATHLEEKLSEAGLKRIQIEGNPGSDWILIDAGDIVVHLFKPEARDAYGLEKMWAADLDESEEEDKASA